MSALAVRRTVMLPCGHVGRDCGGGNCPNCYAHTPRQAARRRWRRMIDRCTNPAHPFWKDYGGRGITVCTEWLGSFEAYYEATGDRPRPGLTIDRIDNDRGYEPGNIRWATAREQTLNSRHSERAKTHCPRGHAYDEANTYIYPAGWRRCRTCSREAKRASRRAAA
jgi:hypothetical protein